MVASYANADVLREERVTSLRTSAWEAICVAAYGNLYNNQITARSLIDQSAVGYCADKPTEKILLLLNYYIKTIDHKFLWFMS